MAARQFVDVERLFAKMKREKEEFAACRGQGAPSFPRLQGRDSCSNNTRHSDVGNGVLDEEGLGIVGSAFSLIALSFSLVDQSLVAAK